MKQQQMTQNNARQIARLSELLGMMLDEVLRKGFHGTAQFAVTVQNGTIQNIRRTVERIDK